MDINQASKTTRALIFRCIYAVVVLAILSISAFLAVRVQVAEESAISQLVSHCHRQIERFYRGRRLAESLTSDLTQRQRDRNRRDLRNLTHDLEATHRVLVQGDPARGLPAAESPTVRSYIFDPDYDLDRKARQFFRLLNQVAQDAEAGPLPPDNPGLVEISQLFATNSPIDALEHIATYYRTQEEARIARVNLLNHWHFASFLAVLAFVALLVFLPMIRRIDVVLGDLASLNSTLEQRVADRTAALIARARELEASNNALRELRAAMENAVEGIARLDTNENYLSTNHAYASMFGMEGRDLVHKGWRDWVHPDDRERVAAAFETTRSQGKCEVDLRGLHQAGYSFHMQMVLVEALSKNRKFDGFHCFAKNITSRKLVENALRDSEERFRQMADHIQQVLWLSEPEVNRIIYISPAFEEVFGRSCESLYKSMDTWDAAIYPQDRERVLEARQARQLDGSYDEEYRVVRPDGSIRWIRDRAFPIHADQEGVRRVAGIAEDVTQARQLQQAILLSQRSFENLIMNCDVAMVVTNGQGKVQFVNPAAKALLRQQAREFLATVSEFVTDSQQARHELPVCTDGKEISIVEVSIIRTEWDGEGARLVIFRDITDRKLAEQELHAYADELKRSNKELEDFAFVASHDLQEPLRKIRAFGDRLIKKFMPVLGKDGQEYLVRMQSAADRMNILIQDLLTYSRVTTKAQPFKEVDLNEVAREVLSDLEVRIEQSRGQVVLEELPTIEADPTQMRQLLQNLIGNALKFRKPDAPPVVRVYAEHIEERQGTTLHETHHEAEERFRLLVEDNGIGFDEKYLDRIFEVFQRLHGRGEYEGTGTGLAVCRKIVVRHGGTITARSAPGTGTTFIATMPLRQRNAS